MALLVEDGTVVTGAESYVTVAEADTYFALRGKTTWEDFDISEKEIWLRLGAQQMEAVYRTLWKGAKRLTDTDKTGTILEPHEQPLSWPRKDVEDEDGEDLDSDLIPELLKQAQMEIALVVSGGTNFVVDSISRDTAGVIREKIGPIETEWDEGSQSVPTYPLIDQLLEPLIEGSGHNKLDARLGLSASEINELENAGIDPFFDPAQWPEFFTIIND